MLWLVVLVIVVVALLGVTEHSYLSKFEYADDSGFSTNLTEVSNVQQLDPGDLEITAAPSHHLRSTGAVKTKEVGMIEDAPIMSDVLYDETVYAALSTIALARTKKYWRLTEPGSSTLTGQGFIKTLGRPRSPDDGMIVFRLAVQPVDKWAFTAV